MSIQVNQLSKSFDYYKKELQKWGEVLECRGRSHKRIRIKNEEGESKELKCEGDGHGDTVELKVGTEDRQRVVAVKPRGKGAEFSLGYVNTRGKDETI